VVPGGLIAGPCRGPPALEEKVGDEVPEADDGLPPGPAGTPAAGSPVAGYRLQEQIGQGARPPGRAGTVLASRGGADPGGRGGQATTPGDGPDQVGQPVTQPGAGRDRVGQPVARPGDGPGQADRPVTQPSHAAGLDRDGPAARRPRWRLPVAALAAALVIGGVSAAIVLSGGHKPPPPHGSPTSAAHHATASRAPASGPPASSAPATSAAASPRATTQSPPAAVPLSRFRVCTFPADTCNSGNPTAMQTEPTEIVTTGDGSGFLKALTWSGWSTATAQGTGLLEVDNCNPNCAQGTFTGYQATVTLSDLTPYGNGDEAYADMTVTAPGSPVPQQDFSTGLVP
jgi:hypothetical protein